MKQSSIFAGAFVLLPAIILSAAGSPSGKSNARLSAPKGEFERYVAPFIAKYCAGCHAGPNAPKGIALAGTKSLSGILRARGVWDRSGRALSDHVMPQATAPQPSAAEREEVGGWIQRTL